jgi:hypothetical protein
MMRAGHITARPDMGPSFSSCFGSAAKAEFATRDKKRPGGSMRKLSTFVIVISMVASSAWADPLTAGKPAGVRAAQSSGTEWMVFGGIGALAAGILIATSGGRSSPANPGQPITVVATTATAT